jgi:hypothetical protein
MEKSMPWCSASIYIHSGRIIVAWRMDGWRKEGREEGSKVRITVSRGRKGGIASKHKDVHPMVISKIGMAPGSSRREWEYGEARPRRLRPKEEPTTRPHAANKRIAAARLM